MCTKKKVELKTKSTIQIKNLLDKYDVIYDTDEKDDLIDLYVGYLEHIKESSKKKTSIKKRKLINTCNINFETQYAYTNIDEDEYIHIDEIINENKKYKCLLCNNGHELVLVNGKKNKPHFRHKNSEDTDMDNPMTKWHCEWQGNFLKCEVYFNNKDKNKCIKTKRYADVLLNNTTTIEFQHSPITLEEVNDRKNDFALHHKNIIWVVDGNRTIKENELKCSNRIYLEFTTDYWKYQSFLNYEYIYIDIDERIYKIYPNKIKSHMIDVQNPKNKSEFIQALKDNINLWEDDIPIQTRMTIKQQGAGNGKTYGIIQMLEEDNYQHYNCFIIVTKQHAAKSVIYDEFKDQYEKNILKYIKINKEEKKSNKYIIEYHNNRINKDCKIIIATVDSFMYSIGDKNKKGINKFEEIVNSVIDGTIETTERGKIKYASINPKLNKETLLVIDETQDLTENYGKAILKIMRNKYIDTYIVGDKLQSISYEQNSFVYLLENEFSYVRKENVKRINLCRRFINKSLINFVNTMINFNEFKLDIIDTPPDLIGIEDKDALCIFNGQSIYNDDNEDKINNEVEQIMIKFDNEVELNNRVPEDFLIVTSFTTKNPLINALEIAIDIYWKDKFNHNKYQNNVLKKNNYWKDNINRDNYTRYAVFHKSVRGTSIDLEESKKATRLVSVHSSKGDGRKVVFVIGITESGLRKFSGLSDNLVYTSLLHVAITRMEEKLYIRYEDNNDKLALKFNRYLIENYDDENISPIINISHSIDYNYIKEYNQRIVYDVLDKNIIKKSKNQDIIEKEEEKKIIDLGHHQIRFYTFYINILLKITTLENHNIINDDNFKRQIYEKLRAIKDTNKIKEYKTWKGYNKCLSTNFKNRFNDNKKFIPILDLSDKGKDYKKYYKFISIFIKKIQEKLDLLINKKKMIEKLCPYESVILHYMMSSYNDGIFTDIHISDVYNITNIYNNSFNKLMKGHDNCCCKDYFTKDNDLNTKDNEMQKYILNHYENINKVDIILDNFNSKYNNISWLINHPVNYNGNKHFKLWNKFNLIGYNDKNVINCYIKPQLNSLNLEEIKLNSIYDTYLLQNINKEENNYNRFNNKEIITCIFTFDTEEPQYLIWNKEIIQHNNKMFEDNIYKYICEEYSKENNIIFKFYQFWKNKYISENKKFRPLKLIKYINTKYIDEKDKYEICTKKIPIYIDKLLNHIEYSIENCTDKKNKLKILENYDNKEYFLSVINEKLKDSINAFLGLDEDSDSDDDDY